MLTKQHTDFYRYLSKYHTLKATPALRSTAPTFLEGGNKQLPNNNLPLGNLIVWL